MPDFLSFFIILVAALLISRAFQRFNIPWTVALIIGGMIIGPFGLKLIAIDSTLEFLKHLGLVFLMFMAGLETKFSGIKETWKDSGVIATATGVIPFIIGISIGFLLGYETTTAILLGIVFISSSIAIAIPMLEAKGLLFSRIGKTIVSSIVLQDIASLVILAVALQYMISGAVPLPIFITLFFIVLFFIAIMRWGIPKLRWLFEEEEKKNHFERDLRVVVAVLLGTVIVSELLGLHSIVGAFLAGLVLSEVIENKKLKTKIHVMAYGLFIPVFFVMIGASTNIWIFSEINNALTLFLLVIFGSIIAKFSSGWISAKIRGFTSMQSVLVGGTCIPQLSTTLAVVAVGQQHNLIPAELVTALVMLSIATVFVSPLLMNYAAERVKKSYFVVKPSKNSSTSP